MHIFSFISFLNSARVSVIRYMIVCHNAEYYNHKIYYKKAINIYVFFTFFNHNITLKYVIYTFYVVFQLNNV